jgi:hypothetical protein
MYKTRLFNCFIIYKYMLLVTKLLLKCSNLVIFQHFSKAVRGNICVYVGFEICNEKRMKYSVAKRSGSESKRLYTLSRLQ